MKKKFQTIASYQHTKHKGEHNFAPTLTQPDQTLTVREIFDRYRRGQPIDGAKATYFEDDVEMSALVPNWDALDISEKMDFVRYAQEDIQAFKHNYDNPRFKDNKNPDVLEPKKDELTKKDEVTDETQKK